MRMIFGNIIKAFSILELMVVVAIIGIITALSVPTYLVYQTKAKISAVVPTAEMLMAKMAQVYAKTGVMPSLPTQIGYTTRTGFPFTFGNLGPNLDICISELSAPTPSSPTANLPLPNVSAICFSAPGRVDFYMQFALIGIKSVDSFTYLQFSFTLTDTNSTIINHCFLGSGENVNYEKYLPRPPCI